MRSRLTANTDDSSIGIAFPPSLLSSLPLGPMQTEGCEAGRYHTYNARETQSAPDVV